MPKDRYEDEIEEILQKADPDDDISSKAKERPEVPKDGKLVAWEEVPKEISQPRRPKSRSAQGSSLPAITANRLIVAAVIIFVIGLAVRPILLYAFIIAAVLGAGAYYLTQREKKNHPGTTRRGPTKYWRNAPIDFKDDEDEQDGPPNKWRGG
ncbi:MAG: hypothetical protein HQ478_15025 [Chloroflexi bacterium]|nr:hypothetical protein [Chloroflexota bacterium]